MHFPAIQTHLNCKIFSSDQTKVGPRFIFLTLQNENASYRPEERYLNLKYQRQTEVSRDLDIKTLYTLPFPNYNFQGPCFQPSFLPFGAILGDLSNEILQMTPFSLSLFHDLLRWNSQKSLWRIFLKSNLQGFLHKSDVI